MKLIQNEHQKYFPELHLHSIEHNNTSIHPISITENNENEDLETVKLQQPLFIGRKMKFHLRNNSRKHNSIIRHPIPDG